MENKLKKGLVIGFLFIIQISFSQGYIQIQNAFKQSYLNESSGQYARAIEDIKAVYKDNSYEINLRLGWLYYMSGMFNESMVYYNKSIQLMPYSVEARLGMIYPASAKGSWDIVEKQYRAILKVDPKHYTANYKLGLIKYGKGDYVTAVKYFEIIGNLYPFDYDVIIMMAWSNFKVGKHREAKVLFNKALMIRPGDSSASEGLSYLK